jgi:hypothetical protein
VNNRLIDTVVKSQAKTSWRRVSICVALEVFSAVALWWGKLDQQTWALFAGSVASLYVSNDTFEKATKFYLAARGQAPKETEETSGGS